MFGEAVVFFDKKLAENAKYYRKQIGQLASKNRFIAIQFLTLMGNGIWQENARQANNMALRLAHGLKEIQGIKITQDVQCNAVFAQLSPQAIEKLQKDYAFYIWDQSKNEVRWMTAFDTSAEEIDEFINSIKVALA